MKKKFQFTIVSVLALFAAVFATSCASVSSMQTAATVPEGEVRWAIASSATGGDGDAAASVDPNFEASIRYGLTDNADIGLKVNFAGAQASGKIQFVRTDSFDLAVGLEAGYQYVRTGGLDKPASHVLEFQLPVLMEYHFNPYVGLAFGPKFLYAYVAKTDDRADIWGKSGFYTGLMLGLPLRLTQGIWFQPEINVYANAYSKYDDGSGKEEGHSFTNALWQASVSVFFGGL